MNLNIQVLIVVVVTCHLTEHISGRTQSSFSRVLNEGSCFKRPKCNAKYKYRTADGSCNDLQTPTMGATNTTYLRLLPPSYSNNRHIEIRKSVSGADIPNPRLLSRTLFPDRYVPDKVNSHALTQWGQLISLDTSFSMFPFIDCCPGGVFPDPPNPQCLPISVPPGDRYYSKYNVTCLPYSKFDMLDCHLVPPETFSVTTQWLDLSMIYGSSTEVSNSVRSFEGGKLKMDEFDGEMTLPISHESGRSCDLTSSNQSCLLTGDTRVDLSPMTSVLAVILTRQHNKIATILASVNPTWKDEKLFQEARALTIAVYQHITYNEYLPSILSDDFMEATDLRPKSDGYTKYVSKINGVTSIEFAESIARTFQSTVQGTLNLIGGGTKTCPKYVQIGDYWLNTGDLVLNCFNELLKGLVTQPARLYHNYFTVQETDFFSKGSNPYGQDLVTIDIMAGRNLGIPPYNSFREICGLDKLSSFDDLEPIMGTQAVTMLSGLYDSVDDIDLFVGAIFEDPVAPGLTGPVAQCIIAQQYTRWKYGDRFYYEHEGQRGSLTEDQLDEIRTSSFSSLLCQNTQIKWVQKSGFKRVSSRNPVVSCDEIQTVDYTLWTD